MRRLLWLFFLLLFAFPAQGAVFDCFDGDALNRGKTRECVIRGASLTDPTDWEDDDISDPIEILNTGSQVFAYVGDTGTTVTEVYVCDTEADGANPAVNCTLKETLSTRQEGKVVNWQGWVVLRVTTVPGASETTYFRIFGAESPASSSGALPQGQAIVAPTCPSPLGTPCFGYDVWGANVYDTAMAAVETQAPGDVQRVIYVAPGAYSVSATCAPSAGEIQLSGIVADAPVHHHAAGIGHEFHGALQLHLVDDDAEDSHVLSLGPGCTADNHHVYPPAEGASATTMDPGDVGLVYVSGDNHFRNGTVSWRQYHERNNAIRQEGTFESTTATIATLENARVVTQCHDASKTDSKNGLIYMAHTSDTIAPLWETRSDVVLKTDGACPNDYENVVMDDNDTEIMRWFGTDDVTFRCRIGCFRVDNGIGNSILNEGHWKFYAQAAGAYYAKFTSASSAGSFSFDMGDAVFINEVDNWGASTWQDVYPDSGKVRTHGTGAPSAQTASTCFPGWEYYRTDDPGEDAATGGAYICGADSDADQDDPGVWREVVASPMAPGGSLHLPQFANGQATADALLLPTDGSAGLVTIDQGAILFDPNARTLYVGTVDDGAYTDKLIINPWRMYLGSTVAYPALDTGFCVGHLSTETGCDVYLDNLGGAYFNRLQNGGSTADFHVHGDTVTDILNCDASEDSCAILTPVPAAENIDDGTTITADACGGIKRIDTDDETSIATDSTNTFTAPAAGNAGCLMHVCNVDGADQITLDENANFDTVGGDLALGVGDCVEVGSDGSVWRQLGAVVGL